MMLNISFHTSAYIHIDMEELRQTKFCDEYDLALYFSISNALLYNGVKSLNSLMHFIC